MCGKSVKTIVLSGMVSLFFVTAAFAGAPWSLFGEARSVKEGMRPNPWAVELTSKCPPESVDCIPDDSLTYSGVTFKAPNKRLSFADIRKLSTSYKIKEGDCRGGSPRFSIGVDTDGDGKVNGHVFVYLGPAPDFTGCNLGTWEESGNLVDNTDARFDIAQLVAGSPYMAYADALTALGDLAQRPVLYVMLVADGGWLADQVILVDNVRVNNFRLNARGFKKK